MCPKVLMSRLCSQKALGDQGLLWLTKASAISATALLCPAFSLLGISSSSRLDLMVLEIFSNLNGAVIPKEYLLGHFYSVYGQEAFPWALLFPVGSWGAEMWLLRQLRSR